MRVLGGWAADVDGVGSPQAFRLPVLSHGPGCGAGHSSAVLAVDQLRREVASLLQNEVLVLLVANRLFLHKASVGLFFPLLTLEVLCFSENH